MPQNENKRLLSALEFRIFLLKVAEYIKKKEKKNNWQLFTTEVNSVIHNKILILRMV